MLDDASPTMPPEDTVPVSTTAMTTPTPSSEQSETEHEDIDSKLSRMEERMATMQDEIIILKQRNYEKDRGKEFEGSYTRILFLMIITYATLTLYMAFVLDIDTPMLDAIVPTVGFNISTWSLPYVKEWWIQINYYKKHGEFEKLPKTFTSPEEHAKFVQKRHEIMNAATASIRGTGTSKLKKHDSSGDHSMKQDEDVEVGLNEKL